ncbi:hypothetical protein [Streptomyces sp. NPDC052496]|uniref:hypothetical protein n=1 Tax=Streptomyces sp. NPDC052496 TaxID=3154951 RepID=UPI00341A7A17
MSGFSTHRQRVHDTELSARARHASLRTCVVMFRPYGFRATYHHLCCSARIPAQLDADPASLVRAVEELAAARELWLAEESRFVVRRRGEKARGQRRRTEDGSWRDQGPGPEGSLAFCPHPEAHPTEPLPTVVKRIMTSKIPAAEVGSVCRACGSSGATTSWHTGHDLHILCARCGVGLRSQRAEADRLVLAAREDRWRKIWRSKA